MSRDKRQKERQKTKECQSLTQSIVISNGVLLAGGGRNERDAGSRRFHGQNVDIQFIPRAISATAKLHPPSRFRFHSRHQLHRDEKTSNDVYLELG